MKLFINRRSSRRENTLLTILIDNTLTVTCQQNADTSKANMIWKCMRSHVSDRDRKALVPACFSNSTWNLAIYTPEHWIQASGRGGLPGFYRSGEPLSKKETKKKKKHWPKLAQQKTNGGRMTSLYKCRKTKDTEKTWLAAHELPQLVAQTRNLTVDTSFPFAEFGILTIPFLPDYMQICKELTFYLTGKFNPTEMNKVWKPESKSQTPKY